MLSQFGLARMLYMVDCGCKSNLSPWSYRPNAIRTEQKNTNDGIIVELCVYMDGAETSLCSSYVVTCPIDPCLAKAAYLGPTFELVEDIQNM